MRVTLRKPEVANFASISKNGVMLANAIVKELFGVTKCVLERKCYCYIPVQRF